MIEAIIIRFDSNEQGTLGKMSILGRSFFTLELPWLNNESWKSCIPCGIYTVKWTRSQRLKKFTYEILNVTNRAGIRLHGGNLAGSVPRYISHSLGCPLIAYKVGAIKGQRAVLDSRRAVADFERLANKQTIRLEIKNA
ncbi:MAG: DUF5675 family protein [Paludibacter sp.]|nr:DUF5675 family protein [Paludibacter sp.]